ncbi:DUF6261 family protein [Bacteroides sp. OttesenSCG-928-J23]|nr:DUF6261 family protein [Bacteroides sp. OttesenSCG-928-N06]MDL2247442.1 DUF6261 family protein [Bacteroides sp. OttesenSCG-928-J23]MDL2304743.1 DUF6261 family protein [Bacteroides sp. OttesenSCG-928-D19]
MSSKIGTLQLSQLLVASHYNFHRTTNLNINDATAAALNIVELAPVYTEAVTTLGKLVNRAQGSVITEEIAALDLERDGLLSEIFNIIDYAAISQVPTRALPGKTLKRLIAPYRGIQGNELTKETGQIVGLLRDLGATTELITAQEDLNIQAMVQALRKANNKLNDMMSSRATEAETRNVTLSVSTKEQRRVVDDIYNQMLERINATAILQSTEALEAFIIVQNGLVKQYKSVAKHQKAGGTGNEKVTPKPEETPQTPEE